MFVASVAMKGCTRAWVTSRPLPSPSSPVAATAPATAAAEPYGDSAAATTPHGEQRPQ